MDVILTVVFGFAAAWGFASVQSVVAKTRPHERFDGLSNRYLVDLYVWDGDIPRRLRRRYVLTGFCLPLALLSLAHFVATHGPRTTHQEVGVFLAVVMAAYVTGCLVSKVIRHGW